MSKEADLKFLQEKLDGNNLALLMAIASQTPHLSILSSPDWEDYKLLDSGNGYKLERYGPYRLVRPEAEAMWQTALPGCG